MSVRATFLAIAVAILAILGSLLTVMAGVVRNQRELTASEMRRYESYQLADELRQSSDDLTRMARTYVVTGDPRFEAYFRRILAIRNGETERPEAYSRIYWDFVTATRRGSAEEDGRSGSRSTDADDPHAASPTTELALLQDGAGQRSDALVGARGARHGGSEGALPGRGRGTTPILGRAGSRARGASSCTVPEYHRGQGARIMEPVQRVPRAAWTSAPRGESRPRCGNSGRVPRPMTRLVADGRRRRAPAARLRHPRCSGGGCVTPGAASSSVAARQASNAATTRADSHRAPSAGTKLAQLSPTPSTRCRPAIERDIDRAPSARPTELAAGAGGCGLGQPGEECVPRQHEPRAAHADERHHRLQRDDARRSSRRTRISTDYLDRRPQDPLGGGPSSSVADQRHSRPVEDRGRAAWTSIWNASMCAR